MGRFWIGVGLLLALFSLGVWVAFSMNTLHAPVSDTLEEAAEEAISGDLEEGILLARQAQASWEKHWRRTASVADHTPMDEIDGLFAQMDIYAKQGAVIEFAANCSRLAKLIDAVEDAHSLTWWNLL